jgi:hypothetical protein
MKIAYLGRKSFIFSTGSGSFHSRVKYVHMMNKLFPIVVHSIGGDAPQPTVRGSGKKTRNREAAECKN